MIPTMAYDDSIQLALIQHACPVDDRPQRVLETACDMIRQAADRGAKLVVTQELFTSFYFAQWEDERHFTLAETIPGPTTTRLAALVAELGIELSASIYELADDGRRFNTTVLFAPDGSITATYRKMHIPYDPRFYEKFYFEPGDKGFYLWQTTQGPVAPLICYDQWFPEAARTCALRGARLLLYPTAIGWDHDEPDDVGQAQLDAWITIQRAHAIANNVYVAAINRVGTEGNLTFWGSSFVCAPDGRILAQASTDEPAILSVTCDLAVIDSLRQVWPFFRDRRPDVYGG